MLVGVPATGQDKPLNVEARVPADDSDPQGSPANGWPEYVGIDPEPGQYRMSVGLSELSIYSVDGVNIGPGEVGDGEESLVCIRGNEDRTSLIEAFEEDNCREVEASVDGGRFRRSYICEGPGASFQRIDLEGTVTTTSSQMAIAIEGKMEDGTRMVMRVGMNAERVGDCPD